MKNKVTKNNERLLLNFRFILFINSTLKEIKYVVRYSICVFYQDYFTQSSICHTMLELIIYKYVVTLQK